MAVIPNPVVNPALDLTKMSVAIGAYAANIVRQRFRQLDCAKHFDVDMNVTSSKKYPKLIVKGKLRKYDGAIKTTAGSVILSDRELVVKVGQKELPLEPESFRNTWAANMANISEGRVPLEVYILEDFTKNSLQDIDQEMFYKGNKDTTVPAEVGTPIEIADGLEKLLLACTTGPNPSIIPVSVPAFDAGSGSGLNAVAGNYNSICKTVWKAQNPALKKEAVDMFLSIDNYDAFGTSYRREFGHEAKFDKDSLDQEFIYLDGTQKKCRIRPASWLGNSNRIIVAPRGAIIIGTDINGMVGSIKVMDMGYVFVYLQKIIFGVQIIDTDAVTISSQS